MALDELNNRLHSRDFHTDRASRPTFPDGEGVLGEESVQMNQTEVWQESEPKKDFLFFGLLSRKYLQPILLTLGGIAVVAIVFGVAMMIRSSLFQEEDIQLHFSGPNDVASTDAAAFIFEYDNDNWLDLENASVVFEYPETFLPESATNLVINTSRAEQTIGSIPSRGKGSITLSGKFSSYRGDRTFISATLRYSPRGFSSTFEKRIYKEVVIVSSPLFLEIIAPLESADKQKIEYEIRYGNNGATDFSNLRVRLDYPEEFVFSDADPDPVEGNTLWKIDTLAPRTEGKIIVRGTLSGERNQQKTIHGSIGFFKGDGSFAVHGEHERKTRVVASPLFVSQSVNGGTRDVSLIPGERIDYVVSYRNDGNVGIRDAILTVELDSPYLDYTTLRFGDARGFYDQSRREISWKASDLPALARIEPGQVGSALFSIWTYRNLWERFPAARELTLRSLAKIDSPDIPVLTGSTKVIASSDITAKFHTALSSSLAGFYQDVIFENSGPQPMVVGQETTYVIHYSVTNTFNAVEDGRVNILLQTGIRYTGKKSPDSEQISFNERTNELIWNVGSVGPGMKREIAFQVAVVPEPGSVDDEVAVINEALFIGKDSFTGKEHRLKDVYKVGPVSPAP